jgi:hypothetical protein
MCAAGRRGRQEEFFPLTAGNLLRTRGRRRQVRVVPSGEAGTALAAMLAPLGGRGERCTRGEVTMLIGRCAWHRRYQGYPRLSGVVSWRGWAFRFSDGICESCLVRFRAEHRRAVEARRATGAVVPRAPGGASDAAA